jgi:hypothetical protein
LGEAKRLIYPPREELSRGSRSFRDGYSVILEKVADHLELYRLEFPACEAVERLFGELSPTEWAIFSARLRSFFAGEFVHGFMKWS